VKDELKETWKEVITVYPINVLQQHQTGWWQEEILLADDNTKNGIQNSRFPGLDSNGAPWNTSLALQLKCKGVLDEVTWYALTLCDAQTWKQWLNLQFFSPESAT